MANVFAIHSVGNSLVTYLRNSYPEPLRTDLACQFRLLSSGELLATADLPTANTLSLYLYRVTMNEHLRNTSRVNGLNDASVPLSVDLHYLMTVWANGAEAEHTILAWATRELYLHPVLDSSALSSEAQWDAGDFIQLIPAEVTSEDMMRIWNAIDPPYRLSTSYIARVVRIDADRGQDARPVVATRLSYSDEVD
ncbi:MAG TPA: DUF4255 domain-containing protein [Blastocatellia bacterium]|nr:DUF4255 domain-containing protein [Blastocatellia bacterium]